MSYAQIEIGGRMRLELLGELFDRVRDYDVWIPLQVEMQKNVRGETFLGNRRMLGSLEYGPEDEVLTACGLLDWMLYCLWVGREKKALQLECDDQHFNDDAFGGELQELKVDYRLQLPSDPANQCEPLVIRPGERHARTMYASDYVNEPRYSLTEVLEFLEDPAKARRLLKSDGKEVEPLSII